MLPYLRNFFLRGCPGRALTAAEEDDATSSTTRDGDFRFVPALHQQTLKTPHEKSNAADVEPGRVDEKVRRRWRIRDGNVFVQAAAWQPAHADANERIRESPKAKQNHNSHALLSVLTARCWCLPR
jgi:hypothetical protein